VPVRWLCLAQTLRDVAVTSKTSGVRIRMLNGVKVKTTNIRCRFVNV
jgi:hypothetical protein